MKKRGNRSVSGTWNIKAQAEYRSRLAAIRRLIEAYEASMRSNPDGCKETAQVLVDSIRSVLEGIHWEDQLDEPDSSGANGHDNEESVEFDLPVGNDNGLDDVGTARSEFEQELRETMRVRQREVSNGDVAGESERGWIIKIHGRAYCCAISERHWHLSYGAPIFVTRRQYRPAGDPFTSRIPADIWAETLKHSVQSRSGTMDTWVATMLTSENTENLYDSPASADREALSERGSGIVAKDASVAEYGRACEADRALLDGIVVPDETVSVVVAIRSPRTVDDGGETAEHLGGAEKPALRHEEEALRRSTTNGIVCYCDALGQMIGQIRLERAYEPSNEPLKNLLSKIVATVSLRRPNLAVVKISDGEVEVGRFLWSKQMPPGHEVIDIRCAMQHLNAALSSVFGVNSPEMRRQVDELGSVLRCSTYGARRLVLDLKKLVEQYPRNLVLMQELDYFEKNKKHMNYAGLIKKGLMIGTETADAACDGLVSHRFDMIQTGEVDGSNDAARTHSLTVFRDRDREERYNAAWRHITVMGAARITLLDNVICLARPRGAGVRRMSAK